VNITRFDNLQARESPERKRERERERFHRGITIESGSPLPALLRRSTITTNYTNNVVRVASGISKSDVSSERKTDT